jgi:hypothetical protein
MHEAALPEAVVLAIFLVTYLGLAVGGLPGRTVLPLIPV